MSAARDERRALIVLLGVIFLMIAGFGLVIPLLPFFAQAFDAPAWRWMGVNQANCGLTIIRVRSAKPPVLVTHNDLGHLPPELRTGLPESQPF